jgi:hypothetical protein
LPRSGVEDAEKRRTPAGKALSSAATRDVEGVGQKSINGPAGCAGRRQILREGAHKVKHRLTILSLSAAVCVASGAHAQMPGRSDRPGTGAIGHTSDYSEPPTFSAKLPPNPEGTAEDLEMNGKCAQAIPIFRRLAARGTEYAIAQYHLGLCLFDVVKAEPDAHSAASVKQEAAKFVVQAANNGFASAQMSLVAIYLDGDGVGSDPVEAGKWSLIYHENGMRLAIGLPDIAPDLKTRLDNTLSEKAWSEAQTRAATWSPVSRN